MNTKNFARIYINKSDLEETLIAIDLLKKTKIKRDNKLINLLSHAVNYNDQVVKIKEYNDSISLVQLEEGKLLTKPGSRERPAIIKI